MKPNETVIVYGNPIKEETPLGQAKLIKRLPCHAKKLEYWDVAFTDEPNIIRQALIRKR